MHTPKDILYLLPTIRPIYESAFPLDERRDFEDIIHLTEYEPCFHVDICTDNNQTIGFITYWNFAEFIYIEHFAVDESQRGKGYGKKVLSELLHQEELPLVLEVERPEDEISIRRIRFYETMGFSLCKIPYVQPPYSQGKNPVDLFLMSYGKIDLNTKFDLVKSILYKKVYKTEG